MADNYLERKMEDLRSGRAMRQNRSSANPIHQKGIYFPFPPKRILIASDNPWVENIARLFIRTGSKVAILLEDTLRGEKIASDIGVRNLSPANIAENTQEIMADLKYDQYSLLIRNQTDNLLRAWRDLDILIADSGIAVPIIEQWEKHRRIYPPVSDYKSRIILLKTCNKVNADDDVKADNDSLSGYTHQHDIPSALHVTANCLNIVNPERDITSLIAMLTLPSNGYIDNMTLEVN